MTVIHFRGGKIREDEAKKKEGGGRLGERRREGDREAGGRRMGGR